MFDAKRFIEETVSKLKEELKDHPFFIATQGHPEFKSRPNKPHPLFDGFVRTILQNKLR